MDQTLQLLLNQAQALRDKTGNIFYEGQCTAYLLVLSIIQAGAFAKEMEEKKEMREQIKKLTAQVEMNKVGETLRELGAFHDASTKGPPPPWEKPATEPVATPDTGE